MCVWWAGERQYDATSEVRIKKERSKVENKSIFKYFSLAKTTFKLVSSMLVNPKKCTLMRKKMFKNDIVCLRAESSVSCLKKAAKLPQ